MALLLRPLGILWLMAVLIAPFWIYADSRRRYDEGIGCLWALMAVALGPLALIAYLIVRPPEPDGEAPRELPSARKACPACGADNPWNAVFCAACGETMRRPVRSRSVAESRLTCGSCGETVPAGRYCIRCGERLDDEDPRP